MMNEYRLRYLPLLVTALVATLAMASPTDLSWVGELPGIGSRVEKKAADGTDLVYSLSGDPDETFAAVKQGLKERGFTIEKAADAEAVGAVSRSLIATKDGVEAKVNVSAVAGVQTLTVKVAGGEMATTTSNPSTTTAVAAGAIKAGAAVVISESDVTRTYQCSGTAMTINGNDCNLTLEGTVTALTINGNDNTLTINAALTAMTVLGNDNHVSWSSKAHAKPVINNMGNDNTIERVD